MVRTPRVILEIRKRRERKRPIKEVSWKRGTKSILVWRETANLSSRYKRKRGRKWKNHKGTLLNQKIGKWKKTFIAQILCQEWVSCQNFPSCWGIMLGKKRRIISSASFLGVVKAKRKGQRTISRKKEIRRVSFSSETWAPFPRALIRVFKNFKHFLMEVFVIILVNFFYKRTPFFFRTETQKEAFWP